MATVNRSIKTKITAVVLTSGIIASGFSLPNTMLADNVDGDFLHCFSDVTFSLKEKEGNVRVVVTDDNRDCIWKGKTDESGSVVWKDARAGQYYFSFDGENKTYALDLTKDEDVLSYRSVSVSIEEASDSKEDHKQASSQKKAEEETHSSKEDSSLLLTGNESEGFSDDLDMLSAMIRSRHEEAADNLKKEDDSDVSGNEEDSETDEYLTENEANLSEDEIHSDEEGSNETESEDKLNEAESEEESNEMNETETDSNVSDENEEEAEAESNGSGLNEEESSIQSVSSYAANEEAAEYEVSLSVSKEGDGGALAGVQVTVYDADNESVTEAFTNTEGKARVSLASGKYSFVISEVPEGYKLNDKEADFSVASDGTVSGTTSLSVPKDESDPTNADSEGESKLTEKEAETDANVTNVSNEDAKTNEEDQTDSDTESKVNHADVTLSVVSANNPDIAVVGATVAVYDENKNEIILTQTDDKGEVLAEDMQTGSYTMKITDPAEGYYASTKEAAFSVDKEGAVSGETTLSCTPQGVVVLTVTDSSSGDAIAGVSLSVRDASGGEVFSGQTGTGGTLAFPVPVLGSYYFQETAVPEGYTLNAEAYSFSVAEGFAISGTTAIENAPLEGVEAASALTSGTAEGVPKTGIVNYSIGFSLLAVMFLVLGAYSALRAHRKGREKEEN